MQDAFAQSTDLCWRNPKPFCDVTLITEVHVQAVLLSSKRTLVQNFGTPQTSRHEALRGLTLGWEAGILKRVNEKQALGGAVEIGVADGNLRTALKARGRHYLSDNISVELAAGLVRGKISGFSPEPSVGLTTDLRVNAADKVSLFLTYDDTNWPDMPPNDTYQYTDDARARGVRAGASLGSLPAVIGTAAGGLVYVGLLILLISTGAGY